ncbi:MAG: multidrug effflux MFS transporter [Rhodospirillaceae bacterium]|nr:multidrug effflux MFS transporter [Rhodospirillaceae bacterium]
MKAPTKPLSIGEFVPMLALTVSLVAMSTDVMLPALDTIGRDLAVSNPNDTQLIVSMLFLGYALGQLLAGPLSDSFGRKPVVYLGFSIFLVGCLMSMLATDINLMLAGRVLQGLGVAGPRVVPIAIVRDGYEGRAMARIMSFIMAVFILVPTLAPLIGQGVFVLAGWRATFTLLFVMAVIALVWFGLRQPETLPPEKRRVFSVRNVISGIVEICTIRITIGYTITAGLIFGAFIGYLGSSRQIYQDAYNTGLLFPVYFGAAAIAIGAGSVLNAKLVMRLGMRRLSWSAMTFTTVSAAGFALIVHDAGGLPEFWLFMAWLMTLFFCMGLLFGNLNALAMEPLGHMAGLGAAFVGCGSTLVALPLAWFVGGSFNGGVLPLVLGFAGLGMASLVVMRLTDGRWF